MRIPWVEAMISYKQMSADIMNSISLFDFWTISQPFETFIKPMSCSAEN